MEAVELSVNISITVQKKKAENTEGHWNSVTVAVRVMAWALEQKSS